jgi:hypothetical protein
VIHPGNIDRVEGFKKNWRHISRAIKLSPVVTFDGNKRSGTCMEPFKGSINILTDGTVSPCCISAYWGIRIGNLHQTSLKKLVYGDPMKLLMKNFINGNMPSICRSCQEFKAKKIPVRLPERRPKNGPKNR